MSEAEEKTIVYYDKNAQAWAESNGGFDKKSFWKIWMKKFHKLLPSGKIIEIGSGSGKDAADLIKLGYEYVGTDASTGLMKLAIDRNPNQAFKNIRVQDLAEEFDENEFDGFWTAATLLHVSREEIEEVLDIIHRVVKDKGVGFISVKEGEGEKEDETGRLFTYYSQSEFADLLDQHGFKVLERAIQPMSENTTWLIYLARVKK